MLQNFWIQMLLTCYYTIGLLGGASGKQLACQCRRHKRCLFDPWVGKVPWRRALQPTPVFLPGKSHGQRRLVGCCLWGRIESDTTERLHFHFSFFMHRRRKWKPTPVFLPGESQGRGSLLGCRLWGHTESDRTEAT